MGNCCSGNHATADGPNEAAASDTALMEQTHQTAPVSIRSETTPTEEEPRVLEHIADREDLSNKDGTMFLEKSKNTLRMLRNGHRSEKHRHSSVRLSSSHTKSSPVLIKKANSCSTIYTDDSTVSVPNLKFTIKCVSLAIFYHIKNRDRDRTRPPRTLDTFDEKLHPLTREEVPATYADYTPDHKIIYKFIKTLFSSAQLTAECAIIALIYFERLLHYAELDAHPCNWKRMTLGAILLASKVWDDQAVWNVDYCQILRDTRVEDMNELERVFLENLQFNINVASSAYAKYYFDLRSLAEDNGLSSPNEYEVLTQERAKKLEALSRVAESRFGHSTIKKSASTEPISPKKIAVLM